MRKPTTILIGNVLDQLATLPAKSVHCVVTSPPYWGLRDYQTGQWQGGDAACDHLGEPMRTKMGINQNCGTCNDVKNATGREPMGQTCTKCGATREDEQIGLEPVFDCGAWAAKRYGFDPNPCPGCFICTMVNVFDQVYRVLRDDGVCWVNMGDSYSGAGRTGGETGNGTLSYRGKMESNRSRQGKDCDPKRGDAAPGQPMNRVGSGLKPKDRVMQPAILALALQAHGWTLRDEIVWRKPNPMPESVRDRTTKAHEMIYLLTKGPRYFYDADAIRESTSGNAHAHGSGSRHKLAPNGSGTKNNASMGSAISNATAADLPTSRNARSVWTIKPQPFPEAHFATFPVELPLRCIKAGTSAKGCCPACGAPWKRVTAKVPTGKTQKMTDGWDTAEGGHGSVHRDGRQKGEAGVPVTTTTTTGWEPTCTCCDLSDGAERMGNTMRWHKPVPCKALDPFSGSGTTGIAAYQLGVDYIGCELNPEYAAMSHRRIAKETRPSTAASDKLVESPLFGGLNPA